MYGVEWEFKQNMKTKKIFMSMSFLRWMAKGAASSIERVKKVDTNHLKNQ